ncbi:SatD family protein [Actinomyces sp. MRS3W]|uniref:SatD family protein n=1 Tax=Actinomyces sp. MRS3W TaxID=2800796 RepID=UPI0028FDAA3C|nr:SatD family protein [Actinomyces sp. MRS3W]MDU0348817.1 SatD family protein [Actinomyces sp. MRS3W]
MDVSYAVIADIVGSRRLADRRGAQATFVDILGRAAAGLALLQDPVATVGDEFQAVSTSLAGALTLTLRTHLLLPEELSLRFGIGAGRVEALSVDGATSAGIQDGSAWWAAREAIERAHALQDAGRGFCRTWMRAADSGSEAEALVNALLLLRDQAIFRLGPRQRRMAAALLAGATQVEVARAEKVSQQAVSEFSRGPAAALLEAQALLEESGLDLPIREEEP